MTDPSTTPATQQDLAFVLERLGSLEEELHSLKDDVHSLKDDMHSVKDDMRSLREDLTTAFGLAVETIRHDLIGANRDRIEDHEHRIRRLEKAA